MAITMAFRNLARRVTRQGSRAMAAVNDNIQENRELSQMDSTSDDS